jgi:hypothetical protein
MTKDVALEFFFYKNTLLIKDGIKKDKYYSSVHYKNVSG